MLNKLLFVLSLVLLLAGIVLSPRSGFAHPMGNFSISHYARIRVEKNFTEVRYLVDMAEIPTFQEVQDAGIVPEAGHPTLASYLAQKAEELKAGLKLELNGQRLDLKTESREVLFTPGAGALPTMKIGVTYRADLKDGADNNVHELQYADSNFPDRVGWKEIIAVTEPGIVLVNSSAPAQDRSHELTDYPTDLMNSPPQDLQARVAFTVEKPPSIVGASLSAISSSPMDHKNGTHTIIPSSAAEKQSSTALSAADKVAPFHPGASVAPTISLQANRQVTPRNSFTELIANREVGWGIVLMAALVAAGLGAFHALEPGHGKTIIAAYLVGSRGTGWHALLLGLIVTASHTAGVYLLGAVTLYASRFIVPERLYPWLSVISGILIAGLGFYLFLQRRGSVGRHHSHGHVHSHKHHHGHSHDADHGHNDDDHDQHHHHGPHTVVSLRELFALGITGGIVPCPAALVVLLSAVALGRIGFGLLLIVAFSLGLAAVLIAIGLLMISARRFMSRFAIEGPLVRRWLPLTSAAIIAFFGIVMTAQALKTTGLL